MESPPITMNIIALAEIRIVMGFDIVIDLENRIDEFETLKPFITLIAGNICKLDNMVQEYNRLHCRENEFDFDLTVIYLDRPNVIKLDYWGTRINTQ